MPIPDANRAIATDEKVRDYLLNLKHPEGGSKAAWFHSLGYDRASWRKLVEDLLKVARECTSFDAEVSRYGVKYKTRGPIGQSGHRAGSVMTVWIIGGDAPPRLVTAFPDDES